MEEQPDGTFDVLGFPVNWAIHNISETPIRINDNITLHPDGYWGVVNGASVNLGDLGTVEPGGEPDAGELIGPLIGSSISVYREIKGANGKVTGYEEVVISRYHGPTSDPANPYVADFDGFSISRFQLSAFPTLLGLPVPSLSEDVTLVGLDYLSNPKEADVFANIKYTNGQMTYFARRLQVDFGGTIGKKEVWFRPDELPDGSITDMSTSGTVVWSGDLNEIVYKLYRDGRTSDIPSGDIFTDIKGNWFMD